MMYISGMRQQGQRRGGGDVRTRHTGRNKGIYCGNVVHGVFFSRKVKTKGQRTFSKMLVNKKNCGII
jgi:hypothetical protein